MDGVEGFLERQPSDYTYRGKAATYVSPKEEPHNAQESRNFDQCDSVIGYFEEIANNFDQLCFPITQMNLL